MLEIAKDSLI